MQNVKKTNFAGNRTMGAAEQKLRMKREYVFFTDPGKRPKARSLNSESKLSLVKSHRLACFVKALLVGVTPARK